MEIKSSYKFNFKTYKKFVHLTTKWMKPLFLILEIIIGLSILACVFSLISGVTEIISSMIMCIILEAFIISYYVFFPHLSYKLTKITNNVEDNHLFCDDSFIVETKGKNITSQATVKYDILKKVYEDGEHFFIYISKNQAYVVDKATISGGSEGELRNRLVLAVGEKKYKYKL